MKKQFWQYSENYHKQRRPQKLGAFAKWRKANEAEAKRIEERFALENQTNGLPAIHRKENAAFW